jgi:DNA mismatch repair protein MutL
VDDLQSLATMGFRGEALAAICSVSQFEMKTSDGVGTKIISEGGKIVSVEPCARNRGTTIEVKSLFYNVPARKKFQKSANANTAQVAKIVETLSLAHPEVSIQLISNGKTLFKVKKSSFQERVEEVLGPYAHSIEGKVFGFVASPEKAMSTRNGQYLFINRRPIFSPLVAKAVKEAFGTRIGEHTYPPFVLFLEMDPSLVDVNVHPQKREVRFREESHVFQTVLDAVTQVFAIPTPFSEPVSFSPPPIPFSFREETFFDEPAKEEALPFIYSGRSVGVFGPFFLVQEEKLILVHLQGAHARILMEALEEKKGGSQSLIWPLEMEMQKGDEPLLEELNGLGIECRVLGERRFAVDALPPFLEAAQFAPFLEAYLQKRKVDWASSQCVRKKTYSEEEAQAIWQKLKSCKDRMYDPTGKRIWKEISAEDFERWLHG